MELLIVVVIIGILATLALPQFTKSVDRSREPEALNVIGSGLTAQFAYFQEKGLFTKNTTDLTVTMPIMKYWTLPGKAPNFIWDDTSVPGQVSIIAISLDHGHPPASHTIKGIITSTGTRTFEYTRPE